MGLFAKACADTKTRENGNGRAVRNILEQAKRRMAVRLQSGDSGSGSGAPEKPRSHTDLCTLEAEDFRW
eukprot:NODE_10165_length_315_cov_164.596154.p3 GENE.NODE_10165_length_315_cov_164.596154~~NODE_10165_length_315_cov_164.596154.p3  ORF type:complete len:69 (+),score=17.98 NODE_10165_length_315_cov_164.596154:3-209(+)